MNRTRYVLGDQKRIQERAEARVEREVAERLAQHSHPDYGTPNWCPVCSPKNLGYCRCERACNE